MARGLLAVVLAATLGACGIADQLAGHSVEYNVQAATVKNQTLLINILRAAYRQPLQFTDLSTISGQVSVSGSAAFSVPFGGPREGAARIDTFNPSITLSNSPTYTVSVLNTKEFYQGILTPIPMKSLSYYLNIGFPEYPLLTLVVSEIEYGPRNARKRLYNIPDKHVDAAGVKLEQQFPELLRTFIAMGLTVEDVEDTTPLGQPFDKGKYPSPTELVNLDAKGIRVADLGHGRFQLEKLTKDSRFCFDPSLTHGRPVYAGMPVGHTGERLPAGLLCGARRNIAPGQAAKARAAAGAADSPLVIRTHSTEGIIYYLGEIVRLQLGLVPAKTGDWDPDIFHLKEGAGGPGAISASFQGRDYHIDVDPTGADRSSQVLDLVTELLAQNNSAKDLPQPSVIPIAR
ncbi:MAG TPA: hypothetical protein VG651_20015 [Stellaceae bacterium]|nr:hypothetical protein [Stellaceae bacterium]